MKIVRHRDPNPNEYQLSVEMVGGPRDGESYRTVQVIMDDGSKHWLWVSNVRPGYFKQVFVPWDFNLPGWVQGKGKYDNKP